jgi:pimeloyl-ACP methyl ester carboxylesterase
MQVRERRMRTARRDASWLEAGAGWPVVLLHAFPLNADMWRPQLQRVPQGWRFIAPDLRYPAPGLDAYAADVLDLLDCLEIDDAVIAGLSMGGYLAFAMHRLAATRFSGLVLADTRAQADTPEQRQARQRMREVLASGGPPAIADQMLPKLLSTHADAALVGEVRRLIEGGDPAAIDAAIVAMIGRPDSTGDLPRISCATLVVTGELDTVTPPADAEMMQRAIPRSTLTVIRGAAHLANLEQPEPFSKALADFLLASL